MSVAVSVGIAVGANLGDPERAVRAAIARLDALPGTRLVRASKLYRTAPWGVAEQPDFVNAVALVETTLSPHALLAQLMEEERRAGRVRRERWGPRVLDLDLLFHGDTRLDEPSLKLPHPGIAERAFVLEPLAEIAPEWRHPVSGRTAGEMLAALAGTS